MYVGMYVGKPILCQFIAYHFVINQTKLGLLMYVILNKMPKVKIHPSGKTVATSGHPACECYTRHHFNVSLQ
jgi:hypothetical protein